MIMTSITPFLQVLPNVNTIDHDFGGFLMMFVTNPAVLKVKHALIENEGLNIGLLLNFLNSPIIPRLGSLGVLKQKQSTGVQLNLSNFHGKSKQNLRIMNLFQPFFTVSFGVQILNVTEGTEWGTNRDKFGPSRGRRIGFFWLSVFLGMAGVMGAWTVTCPSRSALI